MKFSAFTVLYIPLCFFSINTFSQKAKTDSLSKILPSLQDSIRVDCLNNLSYAFTIAEKKDSAVYYSSLAYREAKQLNYTYGIAISLSRQSHIAKHFDDDFIKSEYLGKESLHYFEKTENKEGIDDLYFYLLYAALAQSRFDEAIYYSEKMYALAQQNDNALQMIDALSWIFVVYRQSGDYEKGFEYVRKAYDLALKTKSKISIANTLYGMAQLHMLIEDYPRALNYFRQVHQMDDQETRNERIRTDNDIWFKMEFTEVFSHLNEFDSAWHYYNLYKPEKHKEVYFRIYWISTGECHYLQKNYDQALRNFELGLADHQRLNDRNEVMRALLDIGKTYVALNNDTAALRYGREGLNIALQVRAKQYIRDGYQILSTVYDRLHRSDSANFYFRQYIVLKEEVLNDQTRAKFAAYNYEQTIALIQKEKEIQQAKLQRELFMKRFLIGGIVLLVLLGIIIVRAVILHRKNERQRLEHEITIQKLSGEKAKSELLQQSIELEMKALRAQMNPHFIFNSLNSINRFILQNNRKKASEYLTKFSKLIRLILQNSQTSLISLENELESLQLFLELEALRFDYHFDYSIILENDLEISSIKVPPLIIQPYAENAIWHGLMHKEEKGFLQIELFMLNDMLSCKITDNGIGRMKAAELKSKSASTHKSMGMQITATRIEMLQRKNKSNASIKITDLILPDGTAGGTEVLLTIPVCYD